MKPKIGTLAIDGFRALRHLEIEGLGRVNLLTGRNNTGKSSVLEALRILASNASTPTIARILHYREEDAEESEGSTRPVEGEGFPMLANLFFGFPSIGESGAPIVISARGAGRSRQVSLALERLTEQRGPDGVLRRWVPQQQELFGDVESESVPGLVIEAETGQRFLPLDYFRRLSSRAYRSEWTDEPWIASVYVSPQGSERTNAFGSLWDKVALSDQEGDVVGALRIIAPDIVGVSMIGGAGARQPRIAIARSTNIPRPVPLRSFGDGLNRLFGIVLSLVNAKGGLLLIDEIENGMHHTVQLDVWRAIFRLSRRLDIQVFATSHSWDSVESFQEAAGEDPDEGVLVRLSRKGDDIVPTVFREDELAVATRDRIELR